MEAPHQATSSFQNFQLFNRLAVQWPKLSNINKATPLGFFLHSLKQTIFRRKMDAWNTIFVQPGRCQNLSFRGSSAKTICDLGVSENGGTPKTPQNDHFRFLVGKPMVVGETHHLRKHPFGVDSTKQFKKPRNRLLGLSTCPFLLEEKNAWLFVKNQSLIT